MISSIAFTIVSEFYQQSTLLETNKQDKLTRNEGNLKSVPARRLFLLFYQQLYQQIPALFHLKQIYIWETSMHVLPMDHRIRSIHLIHLRSGNRQRDRHGL